jgi:hypothetical protein
MADFIDDANEAAEIFLRAALSTYRRPAGPAPTGCCLNCGHALPVSGMRWCNPDCRDDYEDRERANAGRE